MVHRESNVRSEEVEDDSQTPAGTLGYISLKEIVVADWWIWAGTEWLLKYGAENLGKDF